MSHFALDVISLLLFSYMKRENGLFIPIHPTLEAMTFCLQNKCINIFHFDVFLIWQVFKTDVFFVTDVLISLTDVLEIR